MLTLAVRGQVLPLDDQGKVSFYEVVKTDSLKAGQLYTNAKGWLTSRGYVLTEADSLAGRLVASHAFAVYDRGYVTKKVHGKVNYQLVIEVKDHKYRYDFSHFVFAYYKEDRNYQVVPSGKTKALEEGEAPGWQKLWDRHRQDTRTTVENLIAQLKTAVRVLPPSANPLVKQVKKEDW